MIRAASGYLHLIHGSVLLFQVRLVTEVIKKNRDLLGEEMHYILYSLQPGPSFNSDLSTSLRKEVLIQFLNYLQKKKKKNVISDTFPSMIEQQNAYRGSRHHACSPSLPFIIAKKLKLPLVNSDRLNIPVPLK